MIKKNHILFFVVAISILTVCICFVYRLEIVGYIQVVRATKAKGSDNKISILSQFIDSGSPTNIQILVLLKSPRPSIREAAAHVILNCAEENKLGDDVALQSIKSYYNDDNLYVRGCLLSAGVEMLDKEAVNITLQKIIKHSILQKKFGVYLFVLHRKLFREAGDILVQRISSNKLSHDERDFIIRKLAGLIEYKKIALIDNGKEIYWGEYIDKEPEKLLNILVSAWKDHRDKFISVNSYFNKKKEDAPE